MIGTTIKPEGGIPTEMTVTPDSFAPAHKSDLNMALTLTTMMLLVLLIAVSYGAHLLIVCKETYLRSAGSGRRWMLGIGRAGRRWHASRHPDSSGETAHEQTDASSSEESLECAGQERHRVALVSGASGGIGRQIAIRLAERGYGSVLLGRDEVRLRALSRMLGERYGQWSGYIVTDLSCSEAVPKLWEELQQRNVDVEVLVNCAGFAVHGDFAHCSRSRVLEMLQVNVCALTELTRVVLPGMVQRGRGWILNISSVAAFMPGPLLAAYFASKAYVQSFSEALSEEVRGTGVSVTAACPGPTRSRFARRAGLEQTLAFRRRQMPSSEVARRAVDAMFQGKRVIIPSRRLRLELIPARFLPRRWLLSIARYYHQVPAEMCRSESVAASVGSSS